jgi:mono/diheme cytochrome c family protein
MGKALCFVVVLVLLAVIGAGVYRFVLQGNTLPSADGRVAIVLEPGERDLVLAEMRAFLESVQGIVAGAAAGDMAAMARQARKVGAAAQAEVPGSLVGKLPLGFKRLGFDTHRRFDALAMDAESLGDAGHALEQLAELMQNCVACHAAYRLEAEAHP